MANYYNEAREQKRQLKVTSESSRRRAERRAELAAVEVRPLSAFYKRPGRFSQEQIALLETPPDGSVVSYTVLAAILCQLTLQSGPIQTAGEELGLLIRVHCGSFTAQVL